MVALLASANRDPDHFTEPDALDLGRTEEPHIAFGHGIHFCLGAPLARLEADVAFRTLITRFPRMTMAVSQDGLRFRPSLALHSLYELPVLLGD